MNKVLFDLSACQPNRESKFHGGGIYGKIVFQRLVDISPQNLAAFYFSSRFLDPELSALIKERAISTYDGDVISFGEAYRLSKADIVYSPLFNERHDAVIKNGARYYVTIHGLRSLEMLTDKMEPSYATSFNMWLKAKMKGSLMRKKVYERNYNRYGHLLNAENVHVVTVSNHSKHSIKVYYPHVSTDNIDVFYSPSTTIENYKQFDVKSRDKYYLIISANRWLKNAGRAIFALDMLFDSSPSLCRSVKVLGLKKSTRIYKSIKNKGKFELLGYQSQGDLERLYSGAYAFIYPTLNEGFGYPPLEAMKYGTPVISSPFSSIPEVCGDAIIYANPYSIEEIANRILQLEDKCLWNEYNRRGLERYQIINEKQNRDLQNLCSLLLEGK